MGTPSPCQVARQKYIDELQPGSTGICQSWSSYWSPFYHDNVPDEGSDWNWCAKDSEATTVDPAIPDPACINDDQTLHCKARISDHCPARSGIEASPECWCRKKDPN